MAAGQLWQPLVLDEHASPALWGICGMWLQTVADAHRPLGVLEDLERRLAHLRDAHLELMGASAVLDIQSHEWQILRGLRSALSEDGATLRTYGLEHLVELDAVRESIG